MSEKPLMKIKEYAARVGMTCHQAYEAANGGVLPTVRLGRAIMVPVRKADLALGIEQPASFAIAAE